jgi:hypothetical protein
MDKSRKLGWHGFVDTREAIFETLTELSKLKMIPRVFAKRAAGVKFVGY